MHLRKEAISFRHNVKRKSRSYWQKGAKEVGRHISRGAQHLLLLIGKARRSPHIDIQTIVICRSQVCMVSIYPQCPRLLHVITLDARLKGALRRLLPWTLMRLCQRNLVEFS